MRRGAQAISSATRRPLRTPGGAAHNGDMLWVKALHVVFLVTWFAGLFYLPRLFVYHAMARDEVGIARFCVMERKLYWGIMTPGALLTLACGAWLACNLGWDGFRLARWLHVKLALVAVTVGYHVWCGVLLRRFAQGRNARGHVWYRLFNEVPVFFLLGIVVLAVVKPF